MKVKSTTNLLRRFFLFAIIMMIGVVLHAQVEYVDSTAATIDSVTENTVNEVAWEDSSIDRTDYFMDKTGNDFFKNYKRRNTAGQSIREMKSKSPFWYADYVFKKNTVRPDERVPVTEHPLFQTFLWVLIVGGFAAFVILYLANSNAGIFRKSRQLGSEEMNEETDDIFAINFQREIDKAINASDYRYAIRMMFLRVLKSMSEKNVIEYKQDRTNLDYLMQLSATRYYPEFFKLTRTYEYSWYGHFEVDRDNFSQLRKEFENFDRKLT